MDIINIHNTSTILFTKDNGIVQTVSNNGKWIWYPISDIRYLKCVRQVGLYLLSA